MRGVSTVALCEKDRVSSGWTWAGDRSMEHFILGENAVEMSEVASLTFVFEDSTEPITDCAEVQSHHSRAAESDNRLPEDACRCLSRPWL